MLALLVLGSLTTMIVVAERNISRNHKMAKNVFYLADGGHPLAVTVIEDITRGTTGIPYPWQCVWKYGNDIVTIQRNVES